MTASRALRGASDVSAETRRKVEEIAAQIGYVPNRIAGALASNTVNLVGIVVPSISSTVFAEVLRGVSSRLAGSPLKPMIGVSGYNLIEEEEVIREMLSWRPSGLIVAGLEHSDAARTMMAEADCPIVEIMDVDGNPVSHNVGISHLQAGREMAEAVLERGHRKIGFIGTKMPQDYRAEKRLRGFTDALGAHQIGLADRELYSGTSSIENGRVMTAKMMERTPDLDCIYYSSDMMTVGGFMHTLARGLVVPDDIALAGFNDLELLHGLPLRLATTDAHRHEIGEAAAQIVLDDKLSKTPLPAKQIRLQPTLLPGQSI